MTKISFEEWFKMDECMKPLIKLLNEKGYDTKFCCSGHPKQAMWKNTLATQETYFNTLYQLGKARVKGIDGYQPYGYIWFKREKDRDKIFNELKKTNYSKRILNYSSFDREKALAEDKEWLENLDKVWIELDIKGITQEQINNFWLNFARRLKRILK